MEATNSVNILFETLKTIIVLFSLGWGYPIMWYGDVPNFRVPILLSIFGIMGRHFLYLGEPRNYGAYFDHPSLNPCFFSPFCIFLT